MTTTSSTEVPVVLDETTPMTLTEIYNQVMANDELLLTIPADEEQALRTGLAGVKAKQNAKLKASGLQPDKSTLSFVVTPVKGKDGVVIPETIDVHIVLSRKQTITVLAMKLPDDQVF